MSKVIYYSTNCMKDVLSLRFTFELTKIRDWNYWMLVAPQAHFRKVTIHTIGKSGCVRDKIMGPCVTLFRDLAFENQGADLQSANRNHA